MKPHRAHIEMLSLVENETEVEMLTRLKREYGASALKLSTEDAAMGFDQIGFWTRRCKDLLPVYVKIGGPNARNDIRELVRREVDGLIAPMVESPYGLLNFIEALKTFTTPLQYRHIKKHINIETITAVEQLDAILALPEADDLDEITIGCSDLSGSMGKSVTHPDVTARVRECTEKIRAFGKPVSVGGGITPANIDSRLKTLAPSHFNTRVVTFSYDPAQSYPDAVRMALDFELEMLDRDRLEGFLTPEEARERSVKLKKRLS